MILIPRKLRLASATNDTVAPAATLTPVAAAVAEAAFQQSHHSMAMAYLNEIENFMTSCLFVSTADYESRRRKLRLSSATTDTSLWRTPPPR